MTKKLHKLLERQIKKAEVSFEKVPDRLIAWQVFVECVSETYDNYEDDRDLLERSLQISSEEMQERYRRMNEAEFLLNSTQSLAKVGGWRYDLKTEKLTWTDETYRIHGLRIGHDISLESSFELYSDEVRTKLNSLLKEVTSEGKAYVFEFDLELKDGSKKRVRTNSERMSIKGEPVGLIGSFQDVTDAYETEQKRRELQGQLVHAAKLGSLGEMAAGVAHELNNPLAIVSGTLYMLRRKIKATDCLDDLDVIHRQIGRMTEIIKHLRAVARDSSSDSFKPIILADCVQEATVILKHRFKNLEIEFKFDDQSEGAEVNGNVVQLESVFQNLITNSVQAFEENEDIEHKCLHIKVERHGSDVFVLLTDNAGGMDQETQEKLFDPFYTTKEVGVGTGLGMSIVNGIVKDHLGRVNFTSEKGKGTTFRLEFPAHNAVSVETTNNSDQEVEGETKPSILIVDDEPHICRLLKGFLEEEFVVYDYTDSSKARDAIRKRQFNYVMTDLRMPNVDGYEIIRMTRELYSDTIIVVMSGHGGIAKDRDRCMSLGCDVIVPKPFGSPEELIELLTDVRQKKAAA